MQHLDAMCRHCGGGDWIVESGVKCTSLHAQCFMKGGKFRKNSKVYLLLLSDEGFYPKCMVEWF
jgi:DNA polymerase zeta